MATEKSSFAVSLTKFFTNLFHHFPKLLLTNLLFAVPAGVFFAIFWIVNVVTGINSNFILFLTAIPVFPFYAGVVQVTSHMVRGEENIAVFSNFKTAVKENFLRFLVHGIVFYFAIFFSYYSILMYSKFGNVNNMYYVFLGVSIIVTIFFLFAFYYIPSMTVTFDLSMKNIYKNSALMTFGEFKHNLVATLGLFALLLVCATVLMCCVVPIAVLIATIVLVFLFLPSISSFIINSAVYKPMYNMIVGKDEKSKEIDRKMENRRNGLFIDDIEEEKPNIAQGFENVKVDENDDADEYIYHNGRMIKRSVLLKMKKETENKEAD
ncbi:MAG: DUF624 domain-containing protein [Ruminococcus sp.]|nr:DUF624 domain-containing protein [Ruminococcus sp.]